MDSPYLNGTSLQRYPCLDLSAIFRLAREKIQKVIFFFFFFCFRQQKLSYSLLKGNSGKIRIKLFIDKFHSSANRGIIETSVNLHALI